jgi:hypothetical protein
MVAQHCLSHLSREVGERGGKHPQSVVAGVGAHLLWCGGDSHGHPLQVVSDMTQFFTATTSSSPDDSSSLLLMMISAPSLLDALVLHLQNMKCVSVCTHQKKLYMQKIKKKWKYKKTQKHTYPWGPMPHLGEVETLDPGGSHPYIWEILNAHNLVMPPSWKTQSHSDLDVVPLVALPCTRPKTSSMGLRELDHPSLSEASTEALIPEK